MTSAFFQNPAGLENVHKHEAFASCKNGSSLPVQIQLKQFVTPDGLLVLATLRDLSLQKATEEQLNQQSVALASAASSIRPFSPAATARR